MKIAKIAFVIAGAVLLASAIYRMNGTVAIPPHVATSFVSWTAKYNKVYRSPSEKIYRLAVFYKNYQLVKAHNESNATFTMELNHFADMTQEEFKTKMLGYRFENRQRNYAVAQNPNPAPAAIDWRDKGIVNAIKNQGQCGSCWAFSAIQAVESGWAQAKGSLPSLSEQNLVDCSGSYGNHGCNGGLMDYAFKYIKDKGIATEQAYPYTARDGRCKSFTSAASIKGYTDVQQNGQQVENASAEHVLSIAVDAQRWSFYSHGVYSHNQCGTQLDHGVGLVGYGSASGTDFWIVRNSWGTRWGESGYIRLEKQLNSRSGTCGMYMAVSYPTF